MWRGSDGASKEEGEAEVEELEMGCSETNGLVLR
jgi:hypothetical protein